jgi:hypothetical protein
MSEHVASSLLVHLSHCEVTVDGASSQVAGVTCTTSPTTMLVCVIPGEVIAEGGAADAAAGSRAQQAQTDRSRKKR